MAPPTSAHRWHLVLVLALLLAALPSSWAGAEDLQTDRRSREEVRRQRAELAAELEVLGADKAKVEEVLDTLEANVATEQARLAAATTTAERARGEAARAQAEADRMGDEVGELHRHLRDLAVGAFIGDGGQLADLAMVLRSSDAREAARVRYLVGAELERRTRLGEELAEVADALRSAREEAEGARTKATHEREVLAARVADARAARDLHAGFVAEVEAELERRLAEAAALAELDQELAARIMAEEASIAARLAAAAASGSAGSGSAKGHGSGVGHDVSVVSVRGIVVSVSIAANVEALLAAAEADGLVLGGGGYRDAAGQIATRRANCGPSHHDVYEKPASRCRPPTARPGRSMHELGLAIDFTNAGTLITSRRDPGYVWLAANATRFGLHNLPSEPWHWSTNGK